jgi:two-component system response regulator AtoC
MALLRSQRWPGNVRQLENLVERLVVLAQGPSIRADDVKAELARPVRFVTESGIAGGDALDGENPVSEEARLARLSEDVRMAERESLRRALERARGNRALAAQFLGVSRSTLYSKLQEYSLV